MLADLLAAGGDPESWRVALRQAGMASLRELLAGGDPELADLSSTIRRPWRRWPPAVPCCHPRRRRAPQ
ncbi:MAG: hypothetical protein ACRDQU_14665 [Pseudonocardiaceae bacterium]